MLPTIKERRSSRMPLVMDMASPEELAEIFDRAADYVRTLAGSLDTAKLLYFYARFKQAREGPCNIPRPGLFDFKGKDKWDAWDSLGNKTRTEAMVEYISELFNTDPDWEEKAGIAKSPAGLGVAVSTLTNSETDLTDEQKTVFDWCKEGNVTKVSNILKKCDVNQRDSDGMTLLHWACDRGHEDMVRLLLRMQTDVNAQDADGQSSLHYAASCEHQAVVELLVQHGADVTLQDQDGCTAAELSDNPVIKTLLIQDR